VGPRREARLPRRRREGRFSSASGRGGSCRAADHPPGVHGEDRVVIQRAPSRESSAGLDSRSAPTSRVACRWRRCQAWAPGGRPLDGALGATRPGVGRSARASRVSARYRSRPRRWYSGRHPKPRSMAPCNPARPSRARRWRTSREAMTTYASVATSVRTSPGDARRRSPGAEPRATSPRRPALTAAISMRCRRARPRSAIWTEPW